MFQWPWLLLLVVALLAPKPSKSSAFAPSKLGGVGSLIESFLFYRDTEARPVVVDRLFLSEAERFAGLSSGVYGHFAGSPPDPAWSRALSQCELLLDSAALRRFDLIAHFVVLRCSPRREVVVVFRGSEDIFDWLINFSAAPASSAQWAECGQSSSCCLRFHSGALSQVETALTPILEAIRPSLLLGYRVVSTGHSLGGGYATLLHLMLHRLKIAAHSLRLFTFGAPLFLYAENQRPSCLAQLGVDLDFESSSHHFIFANDGVPRLLGSKNSQTLLEGLRFLANENHHGTAPHGTLLPQLDNYFPAGNFYHLVECTCFSVADNPEERVNRDLLTEPDPMIILTGVKTTVDDHAISQYLLALACSQQ